MRSIEYVYPNGAQRAVTFGYDDGREHDRLLVPLFNKYGIKATFFLNSETLDKSGYISGGEVNALYAGHEVAAHTRTHPVLSQQPAEAAVFELIDDRAALEELAGCPVRGFSYPFGDTGGDNAALLKAAGFEYARTVGGSGFALPDDFLLWNPTCHHSSAAELLPSFLAERPWNQLTLLYIWGHSYELEREADLKAFEGIAARLANEKKRVWFAANIEFMDYINALRSLRWRVDGSAVYNRSCVTVYMQSENGIIAIRPGLNDIY